MKVCKCKSCGKIEDVARVNFFFFKCLNESRSTVLVTQKKKKINPGRCDVSVAAVCVDGCVDGCVEESGTPLSVLFLLLSASVSVSN